MFEQLLKENNPEIKVLVNNAGFGKCTDFSPPIGPFKPVWWI